MSRPERWVEKFAYNDAGLVLSRTTPGRSRETLTYDGSGRTISAIDALGRVTTTDYEDDGKTVVVKRPTGVQLAYDAVGNRVGVTPDPNSYRRFRVNVISWKSNTRSYGLELYRVQGGYPLIKQLATAQLEKHEITPTAQLEGSIEVVRTPKGNAIVWKDNRMLGSITYGTTIKIRLQTFIVVPVII